MLEYDSPLKFEARSSCSLNEGEGFILGSVEGKIAIEYFNEGNKSYGFKCHRDETEDSSFIYPVNTLAMHPK